MPAGAYMIPRISPDGRRVAIDNREPGADIWMWDIQRQVMNRITFGRSAYPVWTPDGQHLVFTTFDGQSGIGSLFRQLSVAGGTPDPLLMGSNNRYATSFTPDGTELVFREEAGATGLDIIRLKMEQADSLESLIATPFNEFNPEISPDGRWLAFTSNESGRNEVYVRPLPEVDSGLSLVSTDGGQHPAWARDGRALFYRSPDGALMHVPVESTPMFSAGTPAGLLGPGYFLGGPGRSYDVAPSGERFLMIKAGAESGESPASAGIVLVQSWLQELERLVPVP